MVPISSSMRLRRTLMHENEVRGFQLSAFYFRVRPPIRLEQTRAVHLHSVLDEDAALQFRREEGERHQGVIEVPMRVIAGKDDRLLGMHHP
ncbi:MAG: hypothetical protein ACJ8CR_11095 [Roseiflexaceae bacterium]